MPSARGSKSIKVERGETRGGRQKEPYVFTEQGIAMLSGVLKSEVAVQVSIRLMNVFVAMRRALASIAPIMSRLENQGTHPSGKCDKSKRVGGYLCT